MHGKVKQFFIHMQLTYVFLTRVKKLSENCIIRNLLLILRQQTASQRPGQGLCGRVCGIMDCVYSTLFLDTSKSGKFLSQSRMRQKGYACGCMCCMSGLRVCGRGNVCPAWYTAFLYDFQDRLLQVEKCVNGQRYGSHAFPFLYLMPMRRVRRQNHET